jgi:hypothetical protein
VLLFDRYLDGVARGGGAIRDTGALEAMIAAITSLTGPLDPHRFALGTSQYGFPRAQVELVRALSSHGAVPRVSEAWRLSLAVAQAQRGQWDSALVAMDQVVANAPDPMWPLYRYRLAVVGAWVGAIDLRTSLAHRTAVAGARDQLPAASRAELAWLDGLLALTRNDARSLAAARQSLKGADSVVAPFLDRSLAAYQLALAGDRSGASDSLVALERERAELGWSRFRSDSHPFLTAVNRLSAARWLVERGDAAAAEWLLTWHQAVLFPMRDTREANAIVEPLAYLERGRVAESLGRRELARIYYQRFLWQYDAPPAAHRRLVEEAQAALVRLRTPA